MSFMIPGKAFLTLTPRAEKRIRAMAEEKGVYALRLGVKKGGCAGMEYVMEEAAERKPGEELIEQEGARVLVSPMASMFLLGCEVDYETGLLESGFKFRNPNVVDSCGCGESVKFAGQPEAADGEIQDCGR